MSEKELGTCDDLQDVKHPYDSFECQNWQPCEPVASPQATRPFGDHTVRARCEKCGKIWVYDRREQLGRDRPLCPECDAAQPAAGTTPSPNIFGHCRSHRGVHMYRPSCLDWSANRTGTLPRCPQCDEEKVSKRKPCPHIASEGTTPQAERPKQVAIHVFQQDWIPGFAAFHDDGCISETAKAHVVLNLGSFMSAIQTKDLDPKDLPYFVAESLMHEVIHVLEAWANVEFSEDRVEALLTKYREKYERATIWEYTGGKPHE